MAQPPECSAADQWCRLGDQFQILANEVQSTHGLRLRAYTVLQLNLSREVADWRLDDAASETFRARFELLGRGAGQALGTQMGRSFDDLSDIAWKYWLHRLFQYLWELRSNVADLRGNSLTSHLFVSSTKNGGTVRAELPAIEDVCDASVVFCQSLQWRATSRATQETVAQRFQEWIEDNFAGVPSTWGNVSDRDWVSLVAKGATTQIPIEFLSARLNELGTLRETAVSGSPRSFFDKVAGKHGLVWGVTGNGLWMAQQAPVGTVYVDSQGRLHGGDSREGDDQTHKIVSQAPPPIKALRGGTHIPPKPEPKPTRMPILPPHYSSELQFPTEKVITKALREFATQAQSDGLCRAFVTGITPAVAAHLSKRGPCAQTAPSLRSRR